MARKQTVKKIGYTDSRGYEYAVIDLDALVVDFSNPRIPSQESALESMLKLLAEDGEGMLNLAGDIVERGTNPGEIPNVTPTQDGRFVVREGNRRLTVRKILANPEQLKGHVSEPDLKRWRALTHDARTKALPTELLCVIGDDHDEWVDRRHLGPQGGRGLVPWDNEAKRRRDTRRSNKLDLPVQVLDALNVHDPQRFSDLKPPKRTFTTFARVIESTEGRAALGLTLDDDGRILLKRGDQSVRLLEEILRDLRKKGADKLTSRRIHSTKQILGYLDEAKQRIPASVKRTPLTLGTGTGPQAAKGAGASGGQTKGSAPSKDVMRSMTVPTDRRLRSIFEELRKARKRELPNAAIVLTRVLLELSIDAYATKQTLPFAGDIDPTLDAVLPGFYAELNKAGVTLPKEIRNGLKWAKTKPMSLADKLAAVISDLVARKVLPHKEAAALTRQLHAADVVQLLNDAVHRLLISPTIPRVNHILDAVQPIFNAMLKS